MDKNRKVLHPFAFFPTIKMMTYSSGVSLPFTSLTLGVAKSTKSMHSKGCTLREAFFGSSKVFREDISRDQFQGEYSVLRRWVYWSTIYSGYPPTEDVSVIS